MSAQPLSTVARLFLGSALACLLCLASGCGDGTGAYVPVTGKVTLNGKPLTSGWVNYRPDKANGNNFGGEPIGEINAQGEYTLETKGKPGAPTGAYKIVVSPGGASTLDNTKAKPQTTISTLYQNVDTTPLHVVVADKAAPGTYDLKVGR